MSEIKNFSKEEKLKVIPLFKESIFNSTLYIDLDSTYEKSLNDSNEEESENIGDEDDDIKQESFQIKELIEELDSPKSDMIKINNSFNNNKTSTALINNGYKFIPKKNRNNINNSGKYKVKNSENNINNNINNNKYEFKHKKEKKDDWICKYCLTLNFAFRKKCNNINV